MRLAGGGAKGSAEAGAAPRPAGPAGCKGEKAVPALEGSGRAVKGGPKLAATGNPVFAAAIMEGGRGGTGVGGTVARPGGVGTAGAAGGLEAPAAGRITVTAPMACSWRTRAWAWLGSRFCPARRFLAAMAFDTVANATPCLDERAVAKRVSPAGEGSAEPTTNTSKS